MTDIPTPKTDAMASMRRATSEWVAHGCDLERLLTIEKNRAEGMGKLAHANACEAVEYRRLLTIAREALDKLARLGYEPYFGNSDGNIIALNAIELTAPKP